METLPLVVPSAGFDSFVLAALPSIETAETISRDSARDRSLGRLEMGAAFAITTLAVYLHIFFCHHVGAFWRDEVNSINLANLPTFGETWHYLQFDSFPIAFLALLKTCGTLFSPANDTAFRVLGLIIGLAVLATLWLNARLLGLRWPVLSLALLGINPLFLRYTDSIRAYGLGIVFMLLTFGAVWRVVESPGMKRWLVATGLAILSVQTSYYNSVLLLAVCVGAAAAAACIRQWKTSVCSLAIGFPPAVSLLIYAPTIHQLKDWNFLVRYPTTTAWLWHVCSDLTGSPNSFNVWVWSGLVIVACFAAASAVFSRTPLPQEANGERLVDPAIVFATVTLIVATIGYTVFLLVLGYRTQVWYYIAYLALVAGCLDVIFGCILWRGGTRVDRRWRLVLVTFAAMFVAAGFFPARQELLTTQTNLDTAAAFVAKHALEGDVILHMRWECAITFSRYYHGPAKQLTLPSLEDHRFHRYDLVLKQMMTPDAVRPVLEQVGDALRGGHQVWVIGDIVPLRSGRRPPPIAAAWKGADGWHLGGPYYTAWQTEASWYLQQHATAGGEIDLGESQQVMKHEDLALGLVTGWQEAPGTAGSAPTQAMAAQP